MIALPDTQALFAPELDFDSFADRLWAYQLQENEVVARYCALLEDRSMQFLPIRFFKDFDMRSGADWTAQAVFKSSGTTGQTQSRHLVRDLSLYETSVMEAFRQYYGEGEYAIFALLPNYLERGESSLVYMVQHWILRFGLPGSGFYLYDFDALRQGLADAVKRGQRILLIGVSFALLDFAESHALALPSGSIVMETGGMKGRGKELSRSELHDRLRNAFSLSEIHSEYGMTELLSQAYSTGNQRFFCPPWMRVVITDPYNPTRKLPFGEAGRINVIDLANVHSCAFIATDDCGVKHADGSFEVLGRLENAELRGCNLLYLT
ncbi:MAG TPA: acyl transferase [Bacteroidia bacterium]|nr:acyl transferase [Bacteroidia bacterium]